MKYSVRIVTDSVEVALAKRLIEDAFQRRGMGSLEELEYDHILASFDSRTNDILGAVTITRPGHVFRCEKLYAVELSPFLPSGTTRDEYFELSSIAKSLASNIPRYDMVFLSLLLGATQFAKSEKYSGWLATMPPSIAGMLRRSGFELNSLRFSLPPKPIYKPGPSEVMPEVVLGRVQEFTVLINNKFGKLVERGIIRTDLSGAPSSAVGIPK